MFERLAANLLAQGMTEHTGQAGNKTEQVYIWISKSYLLQIEIIPFHIYIFWRKSA